MNTHEKPVLGMILKGYPRISETFISNEILLLEKQGFSIRLFSMRHPRESFSHKSVKQIQAEVDYLPHTILKGLPAFLYHNLLLACKSPRQYAGAVRMAFRRFCRTRKSATIKHLLQAGYLVHKLLPGRNIVHLHAHFAHSPTSVAMFACQLSGLPFSFTAHAKDIYTSDSRQIREKIGLARFVVTCTEYNRRYLNVLSNGLRTPVHRVYHGIDTDLFSCVPGRETISAPYQILTVARLVPKKGLSTIYRALRILKDQGISFCHTLIGDGDHREEIHALIRKLELSDSCQCLGTLPHEKVLNYYRMSHLFVLGCKVASNGDRDGIPNVLAESMAMGVPIVVTNVSAIPELVQTGKTGLLISPDDPTEMAESMIRLLNDGELRNQIIVNAEKHVQKVFDNKLLTVELAEIFMNETILPDGQTTVGQ